MLSQQPPISACKKTAVAKQTIPQTAAHIEKPHFPLPLLCSASVALA